MSFDNLLTMVSVIGGFFGFVALIVWIGLKYAQWYGKAEENRERTEAKRAFEENMRRDRLMREVADEILRERGETP